MEANNNESIKEKDLIVMDDDEIFIKVKESVLLRGEERINEILKFDGRFPYMLYMDFLSMLTEDWPEDEKKKLFADLHENRMAIDKECYDVDLKTQEDLADDGRTVLRLNFEFDPEKNETN